MPPRTILGIVECPKTYRGDFVLLRLQKSCCQLIGTLSDVDLDDRQVLSNALFPRHLFCCTRWLFPANDHRLGRTRMVGPVGEIPRIV